MSKLTSVQIRGYRSIRDATLELRPLNVLIGANGAGKSNLVSFFKMMNELMAGRLQQFVRSTGHATSNLHFGPSVTPQLDAELKFKTDSGDLNTYRMRLGHAARDTLIFTEECLWYRRRGYQEGNEVQLGPGHQETLIGNTVEGNGPASRSARVFRHLLNNCRVFHFHNTSSTSKVRNFSYIGNDHPLMPDAANLAAVLHRLELDNASTYRRIVETVQLIAPFFAGFALKPLGPGNKDVILNWRHHESDMIFGPHQLSDGTLRAICLISLLLLPPDELPMLIVIDEPELGLHPYALKVLASLCRSTSSGSQILISTQSSALVSSFEPEDVVIVKRDGQASTLFRPDAKNLEDWLDDYSLGEIWEKNVIGGGPH